MNQHDIVRDLIPSYLDGITSESSNQLVEDHLKNCPDCRQYLETMQQEFSTTPIEEKKIDAFKKIRRVNRKKVIGAIVGTLLCCLLAVGGYAYIYGRNWLASSEDVVMRYSNVNQIGGLSFQTKNPQRMVLFSGNADAKEPVYEVREKRISPFFKPLRERAYLSYTFVDQDTIIDNDGKERKLTADDLITIKFEDKTEKIKIADLYDGQALKERERL